MAETIYHRSRLYRASQEEPGWFSQYRELVGKVDARFHDIRSGVQYVRYHNPDSYNASQKLATSLRASGSNGLVYTSVRDPEGQCLAAFWPDVVDIPVQSRHFAYHFDGDRIDMIRDESSRKVYRVIRAGKS